MAHWPDGVFCLLEMTEALAELRAAAPVKRVVKCMVLEGRKIGPLAPELVAEGTIDGWGSE